MERTFNSKTNDEAYIQELLNMELDELEKNSEALTQNRPAERNEVVNAEPNLNNIEENEKKSNSRNTSQDLEKSYLASDYLADNITVSTIFSIIESSPNSHSSESNNGIGDMNIVIRNQTENQLVYNSVNPVEHRVPVENPAPSIQHFIARNNQGPNIRSNKLPRNRAINYNNRGLGSYESLLKLDEDAYDRGKGFKPEALAQMIVLKFKPRNQNLNCNICIDDFQVGQSYVILQCLHYYHEKCIKNWLSRKKTCPFCLSEVKLD